MTVDEIQKHLLGRARLAEETAAGWRESGNTEMVATCEGRAAAFREAARMLADRTDR